MTAANRTIVWIVSYPKSGNTWVRFLVCNLAFGLQDSAARSTAWLPIFTSWPGARPADGTVFIKTHFRYSGRFAARALHRGSDLCRSAIRGMSCFRTITTPDAAAARRRPTCIPAAVRDQYLAARGDPVGSNRAWVRGMSTSSVGWAHNIHFGISRPLRRPPRGSPAGRTPDLLLPGVGANGRRIDSAVANASFGRMRQIEEADIRARNVGIFYKPYLQQSIDSGLRFMRAGKAGEAAQVLTPEQRQRSESTFGAIMRDLGYGGQPG